ncbi:MAG TPA: NAD(P)H-binding protein [Nevskiales bacterium]|nr:NAD(P)H-binding protein [Nevskiales bacterium]
MPKLCALVAGATGAVGRVLVDQLLEDPDVALVQVVARRTTGRQHPRLVEFVTDFDDLEDYSRRHPQLLSVDAVFCCLGTTLRAAGSREAFEKVDYHYVLKLAELASARRVPRFLMISAVGAGPKALAYYSRVKGRVEQAVAQLPFTSLHILRPSLLMGPRDEHRPGEAAAQKLAPLLAPFLRGPLARYRPVQTREVAAEMIRLAKQDRPGAYIHHLG